MSSFSKQLTKLKRAFTLIELLVVISIFTIMTGIILANLPEFRDQTSLELLSQQMAINIRTTQVYGIATRVSGGTGDEKFNWYGIRFSMADQTSGEINRSVSRMFSDVDRSGSYNPDKGKDIAEVNYKISRGYVIKGMCSVSSAATTPTCASLESNAIDIVYRRPDPEATFCLDGKQDCAFNPEVFSDLYITIGREVDGNRWKCVKVSGNGQIAVMPGYIKPGDSCYKSPVS